MKKIVKKTIAKVLILNICFYFLNVQFIYAGEIVSISAKVQKENLYEGQNAKDVIEVLGTDKDGNVVEVTEYTVEPEVLKVEDKKLFIKYISDDKIFYKTLDILVEKKMLQELRLELKKGDYFLGEEITPENINVYACYNNGKSEEVAGKCQFENAKLEKLGENLVVVNYTEDGITKSETIKINAKEPQLISIEAKYDQYEVSEGEISRKLLLVTAYYNNNTEKKVEDYKILPYKIQGGKKTQITIYYNGVTCYFEVVGKVEEPKTTEPPKNVPTSTPKSPQKTKVPSKAKSSSFKIKSNISKVVLSKRKENVYNIYTNKNVKFTISAKNIKQIKYQVVKSGKKKSSKKWRKISRNSVTLKNNMKNIVVYFQYINGRGKKVEVKTKGFTIDKIAPVSNIKNRRKYKNNIKLSFKDVGSGIKKAVLNTKVIKNGKKITKNGTYRLQLLDKAGNKRVFCFSIKKVTKPKPTKVPSTPKPTSAPTPKPTEKPQVVKAKSIKLNQTNLELKVNGTAYLNATISPINATNKELIWKSCNTNIVTVSNGRVVAKGKGVTTIIVYSKENTSINCSCTIIVK